MQCRCIHCSAWLTHAHRGLQDAKLASLEAEIAKQKRELERVRADHNRLLRNVRETLVANAEQRRQEELRRQQQEQYLNSLLEGVPGVMGGTGQQNGHGPADDDHPAEN